MRRIALTPRNDWIERLERLGVSEPVYLSEGGTQEHEWREDAMYAFRADEVEMLRNATLEVRRLVLDGVDTALADRDALERMAIPEHTQELLRWSWTEGQRNFISRYDWCYTGEGVPKLYEVNAETCGGMLLTGPGQADFHAGVRPGAGQWNELERQLTTAFSRYGGLKRHFVHFACDLEDATRCYETRFVQSCADAAKLRTRWVSQHDIAFDADTRYFVDGDDEPIHALFLYQPWGVTLDSPMAEHFFEPERVATAMLEPVWRMLVSNKAFLAWLWERNEGHDLLLPTFVDFDPNADRLGESYAEKPIYGSEGANIRLFRDSEVLAENPDQEADSEDGLVYQTLCLLPEFDGTHPVVSTWEVAAQAPALSVREGGLITSYHAPVVPHIIEDS